MSMNKRAKGYIAEERAVELLKREGLRVVARNVKIAGVEVDIIAEEKDVTVFVEVKSSEFVTACPAENVTPNQMRRYVKAAKSYIVSHSLFDRDIRFDVVTVTAENTEHIRAAFDASV